MLIAKSVILAQKVLIDTWWNVNFVSITDNESVEGFNRYMVECESYWGCTDFSQGRCFNRYMVECE